jgi:hypothetical protein
VQLRQSAIIQERGGRGGETFHRETILLKSDMPFVRHWIPLTTSWQLRMLHLFVE